MSIGRRILELCVYPIRKKSKTTDFAGNKTNINNEVTYINSEGFLTTNEEQFIGIYHCGHTADKARGGVCSACQGTVCAECFFTCVHCLRPLCPACATRIGIQSQTVHFCANCLEEFLYQQKIARIKGAIKSFFVKGKNHEQ